MIKFGYTQNSWYHLNPLPRATNFLILTVVLLSVSTPAFSQSRIIFNSWHTFIDRLNQGSRIEVAKPGKLFSGIYFHLRKSATLFPASGPYPYVGVSFNAQGKPIELKDESHLHITYKSTGPLNIILEQNGIKPGSAFFTRLKESPTYREINIPLSAFRMPSWVKLATNIKKHSLSAIKFQVPGNAAANAKLWIKNIALIPHADNQPPEASRHTQWQLQKASPLADKIKRHENGFIPMSKKFYLLGGRSSEAGQTKPTMVLDTASSKWEIRSAPPIEMHHIQPVVYNNKIYILTGYTGKCCQETALDHIYIYDPAAGQWITGPVIPTPFRRGSAGVVLIAGQFYLAGGVTGGHNNQNTRSLRRFDQYDPTTNQWKKLRDMPRVRDHFLAIAIDTNIYFIGGRDSSAPDNSRIMKEIDVYETQKAIWTTLPRSSDIPTSRSGASYISENGKIHVIGGESLDTIHDTHEVFDTRTLRWQQGGRLNTPRHGTQAILSGDTIYISAGAIDILVNETGSTETLKLK